VPIARACLLLILCFNSILKPVRMLNFPPVRLSRLSLGVYNTGTIFWVTPPRVPSSSRSVFKFQTPAPALHHSRCLHPQPAHCMLQPPTRPISQPGPHDNALHRCNQQPAGLTRHSFAPSTPSLPTPDRRLGQALAPRCRCMECADEPLMTQDVQL